jgi:hypothetical protein
MSVFLRLASVPAGIGPTSEATGQPNSYRPCPFETYRVTPLVHTMDHVAFPESIFTEWAADLPRRACRMGESITMASKGTGLHIGITSFQRKISLTFLFLVFSATCFAGGGTCPANAPVAGNNCFFIAANGSDSNNGTSESTPWLHAPGMPNCTSNCASLNAGSGGLGLIFRGGDTWHFGNSSASPYTGGTWDLYGWFSNAYNTNISNCVYEGTQTGCIYAGVDTTWYFGGSWSRPILTGDNSTSGSFVTGCSYQTSNPGGNFGPNSLVNMPGYTILDSFELTGLCASASNTSSGQAYLDGWASSGTYLAASFAENVYMHGWTATSTAGTGSSSHPVTVMKGGSGVHQVFDHIVIDGSDSDPEVAAWGAFPIFSHMRDSIVRYIGQGVGQGCHDIHDNIFEHFYYTELDGHINALECNTDASDSAPNVFYNNIFRHFDPSFTGGEILWFCPNATPEYWFNNLMYDVPNSQVWNIVGPPIYPGCPNTGGQLMFNNTLVDVTQPCYLSNSNSHGQYLTVYNEHLINSPFNATSPCIGATSSTNVPMTDVQATTQGYTTGTSGTIGNGNNCANDSTTPCSPTASNNGTVGAGTNFQSYCTTLASFSSEYAIGTEAANACKYGTTDACGYNLTTHTMSCPGQTAVARPASGAWNAGGYEYGPQDPPPNPPTNLTDVVN